MWLINVHTRQLESFEGTRIPQYAILSHRWEEEEVTFSDIRQGQGKHKKGYRKIDLTCKHTLQEGYKYCWIDTCCIDKSSSAELSEAINSMYDWYKKAANCYAFISDVHNMSLEGFADSAWFTRGWTLQELLAPSNVDFFDHEWNHLGSRQSLKATISRVSGISEYALRWFYPDAYPVAERMSWAAARRTTREEDEAYSLLGIFEINMPLIYGEGRRAFHRLQEEILKNTDDLTLFAWQNAKSSDSFTKLFAESPASFATRGLLVSKVDGAPSANVTSTGSGLSMDLRLVPAAYGAYLAPICSILDSSPHDSGSTTLCMRLERCDDADTFIRVFYDRKVLFELTVNEVDMQVRTVVLSRHVSHRYLSEKMDSEGYGFALPTSLELPDSQVLEIASRTASGTSRLKLTSGTFGVAGILHILSGGGYSVCMHLGFDFDFTAFCLVSHWPANHEAHGFLNLPFSNGGVINIYSNQDIMRLVALMQTGYKLPNVADVKLSLDTMKWNQVSKSFDVDGLGHVTLERQEGVLRPWLMFDIEGDSFDGEVERTSITAERDKWYMIMHSKKAQPEQLKKEAKPPSRMSELFKRRLKPKAAP